MHVHVRDPATGRPVTDLALFAEVMRGIAERCDAIVQPTTGGPLGDDIRTRARVVTEHRPEMASLNAGSINFGLFPVLRHGTEGFEPWEVDYLEDTRDYVFRNTFADVEMLARLFAEAGTKPEFEAYDVGHLFNLRYLLDTGALEAPLHVQFVLGVLGGNGARVDQLVHMHGTARDLLGDDGFTWSVAGVGYPGEFHLAATSLMLGGHVRVGLEDNLRLDPENRAGSNAELVTKAVALADLLDRRPATPDEARDLLRLKGRDAVAFS